LLRRLVNSRCFSLNTIKRGISRYFTSCGLNSHLSPLFKPHALNVEDMFDPLLFQSGFILLDPESYSLQPTIMAHFHVACCSTCHEFYEVQPTCYFFSMLRCISYGWHIPCDYTSIVRVRVRVRVLFWVTLKPKNSSSLSRSQRTLTKYIGILYKITEQVKYQQMSKTDI
jgi:hypothetical protein